MQSGKLLLSGLLITGCMGLVAGCSSSPKKNTPVKSAQADKPDVAKTEYIVRQAPEKAAQQYKVPTGQPLKQKQAKQSRQYSARKNEQAQARLKYQRAWAAKQEQEAKRAKYQQEWEQKQQQQKRVQAASLKASQQQQQLQKQQQAKRQEYHQKWQQQQQAKQQRSQQQAKQQRYQQQKQAQADRRPVVRPATRSVGYGGRGVGNYSAASLSGSFAGNRALLYFIDAMSARHGFSKSYLNGVFSKARNRDDVARLWAGNNGGSSSGRGWYNYRSKFVTAANTQKGVQFWKKHRAHLQRASQRYGVDPEYIVGIMGVETRWGRILGKHRVIDALTTSAIVNKRRSKFFFKELENYLLMTRSERMDPLQPKGSYAGAMGYGQFMPSSFRAFAVDFNGDGIRDLWNPVDAIGSVANYFAKHKWKRGQEVAVPARVSSMAYTSMPDGYKVRYSTSRLAKKGIRPRNGSWSNTGRTHLLALTTVPGGIKEPWIGYHNFYVITRYNHSNYYAMAVHQLAQSVKKEIGGGQYALR
ncbi:MAG: Membrane-bound lytic murein transglycosylase B precursor (EC [uncultured Thiotrichaceae bacterium]|uniref:Membrane-bound lytic murein transglycosylase B (EC) n=1 Tax=uncultured Thiotrichaceae bacterium TaxID=298394 RepID=A0A6S6S9I8_9GAMM|nr:MAG: Membrane-bound lytic murein transglycosylase B precursor (EC [uncultured Thiotrichaceae bacterium]